MYKLPQWLENEQVSKHKSYGTIGKYGKSITYLHIIFKLYVVKKSIK